MDKKWTTSQTEVLNSKGSVLVSASAGTGKTAVLTEKVSRCIIDENVDITNILVMTFSNDAAREMKDRIRIRLEQLLDSPITDLQKKRLEMQIRKFDDAHIQTIHSFCNEVIKKYFYKLGLDSNIKIADNFDIAILKKTALENVLLPEYNKKDESFIALEDYISGLETIEDVILHSYNKLMTITNPLNWLINAIEKYNLSDDEIPKYAIESISKDLDSAIENLQIAMDEYKKADGSILSKEYQQLSYEYSCLNTIKDNLLSGKINAFKENSLDNFGITLRFKKEFEIAKNFRDKARDIMSSYKKSNFSLEKQILRIKSMYPMCKKFAQIIINFNEEYHSLKKNKNIIDFTDMEHYANEILKDPLIARDYQAIFVKVFVDEYQDTSPIQEEIIQKVSRKNNLFCVGDLKQSIYRFRASDPILFSNRSNEYTLKNNGSVIPLNKNFRSSKNVLDCANDVFEHISKFSNEITYSYDDSLIHGRTDNNNYNPVIVNLIKDDTKDILNLSNEEVEAYNIIKFIKENLGRPVFDNKLNSTRPAEYKDFVILCRKLSGISDVLYQVFSKCNIPFFMDKSGQLLDTLEIKLLMNILSVIYFNGNDIDFISIIHEGFLDFNDDDLLNIRNYNKEKTFTMNLLELSKNNSSLLEKKCNKLLNKIQSYKHYLKEFSLIKLVRYVINDLSFMDHIAIMENGKQRVSNVNLFLFYLNNYCLKNNGNLYEFINYLKTVKNSNERIEEANIGFAGNSVRITTIHKSKGLEYPIVILPFMAKAFNQMDQKSNILIDKDAGIGIRYFNNENRERGKNMYRTYIENTVSLKNIEEEMRLLYVAMTRAQDLLYIQGILQYNSSWNTLLEPKNMLDWIISTLTQSGFTIPTDETPINEASIVLNGKWLLSTTKDTDIQEYIDYNNIENDLSSISDILKNNQNIDDIGQINFEDNYYDPIKKSASELHKTSIKKEDLKQIGVDNISSKKGTATHNFFKFYNFKDNVETSINTMIDNQLLTKDEVSLINISSLEKLINDNKEFFDSINSSDDVEKEKIVYYLDENETLISCIIDLIYQDDMGNYNIVDYKTDNIKNSQIVEKCKYHKPQLDVYRKAIENAMNITINNCYLIFTELGKIEKI